MATIKTARKPLEVIRGYLEAGMSLTDAAKVTGYPISALSIMARCWGVKFKQGPPRGWKRVGT
jgi:hypothetical protein